MSHVSKDVFQKAYYGGAASQDPRYAEFHAEFELLASDNCLDLNELTKILDSSASYDKKRVAYEIIVACFPEEAKAIVQPQPGFWDDACTYASTVGSSLLEPFSSSWESAAKKYDASAKSWTDVLAAPVDFIDKAEDNFNSLSQISAYAFDSLVTTPSDQIVKHHFEASDRADVDYAGALLLRSGSQIAGGLVGGVASLADTVIYAGMAIPEGAANVVSQLVFSDTTSANDLIEAVTTETHGWAGASGLVGFVDNLIELSPLNPIAFVRGSYRTFVQDPAIDAAYDKLVNTDLTIGSETEFNTAYSASSDFVSAVFDKLDANTKRSFIDTIKAYAGNTWDAAWEKSSGSMQEGGALAELAAYDSSDEDYISRGARTISMILTYVIPFTKGGKAKIGAIHETIARPFKGSAAPKPPAAPVDTAPPAAPAKPAPKPLKLTDPKVGAAAPETSSAADPRASERAAVSETGERTAPPEEFSIEEGEPAAAPEEFTIDEGTPAAEEFSVIDDSYADEVTDPGAPRRASAPAPRPPRVELTDPPATAEVKVPSEPTQLHPKTQLSIERLVKNGIQRDAITKSCPCCHEAYTSFVEFCFEDGKQLTLIEENQSIPPETTPRTTAPKPRAPITPEPENLSGPTSFELPLSNSPKTATLRMHLQTLLEKAAASYGKNTGTFWTDMTTTMREYSADHPLAQKPDLYDAYTNDSKGSPTQFWSRDFLDRLIETKAVGPRGYWAFGGDFGGRTTNLGRFYLSVRATYAPQYLTALKKIYTQAKSEGRGFMQYKVPTVSENYVRADAGVIYFEAAHQQWFYEQVTQMVKEHPQWFRDEGNIPLFTAQVLDTNGQPVKNLGFAMDPVGGQESFGGTIRDVIESVQVKYAGVPLDKLMTTPGFLDDVISGFERANMDIEHPAFLTKGETGGSGIGIFDYIFKHTDQAQSLLSPPSVEFTPTATPTPSGAPERTNSP